MDGPTHIVTYRHMHATSKYHCKMHIVDIAFITIYNIYFLLSVIHQSASLTIFTFVQPAKWASISHNFFRWIKRINYCCDEVGTLVGLSVCPSICPYVPLASIPLPSVTLPSVPMPSVHLPLMENPRKIVNKAAYMTASVACRLTVEVMQFGAFWQKINHVTDGKTDNVNCKVACIWVTSSYTQQEQLRTLGRGIDGS